MDSGSALPSAAPRPLLSWRAPHLPESDSSAQGSELLTQAVLVEFVPGAGWCSAEDQVKAAVPPLLEKRWPVRLGERGRARPEHNSCQCRADLNGGLCHQSQATGEISNRKA